MKISNKFIKYLYLLITFAMVGGSSCETFEIFNKISASFDGAKPNIGVVSTKDSSSISPVPITFTSPATSAAAVTPVSSTYQLNPANCDPFTDLVAKGFDVIFVDAKNGAAQNSGESWAKAVPSVREAINMVTVKLRSDKISKGNAVKPAFIAIAGGNYEYNNENNVGGSIGARSEIISLYGQVVQAYSNMYIYGGFKITDKCSSVERNDSKEDPYDANDPARQTVIDAQNKASVIAINEPGVNKVRFSHLTLRNGDAKTVGGRTEKGNGGAISLRADKLNEIIFNKIIIDGTNKAGQNGGCVSVIGKDIKNINFTNSNFSGCEALAGNGGGIYVSVTKTLPVPGQPVPPLQATISISHTTIVDNKALVGDGGGIYLGSDTYAGFDGIKITDNQANGFGGGIASLENASFAIANAGNEIVSNETKASAGAGIYINNTTKKDYILEGLKVATNSSNYVGQIKGLGVHVNNAANVSFNTTEVSNHTTAQALGVGIYLKNNTTVSFSALTCDNNTSGNAASKGGCLYSTTPTQLSFGTAARITNNVSGDGGGLYIDNAHLDQLISLTCTGNQAAANGACMYLGGTINGSNPLPINTLVCNNNNATANGGCINSTNKNLEFAKVTCSTNTAGQNGGCLNSNNGNIVFNDSTCDKNTAGQSGGCLNIPNPATIVFNGSTCTKNTASAGNGGCLATGAVDLKVDQLNAKGSTFDGNKAPAGNGGAIYASNNILIDKFYKTLLSNNQAKDGGALYFSALPRLTIKDTKFHKNGAINGGNGGAIYFANGWAEFNSELDDSGTVGNTHNVEHYFPSTTSGYPLHPIIGKTHNYFLSNTAQDGGAIYVAAGNVNFNTFNIDQDISYPTGTNPDGTPRYTNYRYHHYLEFENNIATNNGGAICFGSSVKNPINITGSYMGNQARLGGAIALGGEDNITPKIYIRGRYENNRANESGVIHFNQIKNTDNIDLEGDFNNNQALNGDGAITKITTAINEIRIAGSFVANKCTTNNHEHRCNGAAFNIANAQKIWVQANISKHKVSGDGGFLWADKTGNVLIKNPSPFESSLITNNLAKTMGGVFYFNTINQNLEINGKDGLGLSDLFLSIERRLIGFRESDGQFIQPKILQVSLNRANAGGFLYAGKILGNVSMNDALFTRNSANYGGALFFNGIDGNLSVKESLFHKNLATTYGGAMYVEQVNDALFDGFRHKTDPNVGVRKYFDQASFNANKNWLPIADYLDNLNEFNNTSKYANNSKNIFLAQDNVASEGGFVLFNRVNNLILDHIPMGNNKPQAISVWNLQGKIQGVNRDANEQITGYKDGYDDVTNIIYDDGKAIKDINMFFDADSWSNEYTLNNQDVKAIVGHNGYKKDPSKVNDATKAGIFINDNNPKNVSAVR